MLTFILAAGYLFTVYLLLALAKRTGNKSVPKDLPATNSEKQNQDISVTHQVTEVQQSVEC